jgi:phosphoglycolate phosphatase-like HAD superfamily hydrolase
VEIERMRLGGIIFDLDGTLGDTLPVCFSAFRRAIHEYTGRSLSDQEIRATFGPSEEGIIRNQVPERWQECLEMYVDAYREEHARSREPFPGMRDALQKLGEMGVRRAVVTGKSIVTAEISLDAMGIRSFFDIVQGGRAEGNIKAENIRKVLESWRLAPDAAAYVGDAPADIDSAHEAGVIGLAAAWAGGTRQEVQALTDRRPAAIFHRVDEMMEWIELGVLSPESVFG